MEEKEIGQINNVFSSNQDTEILDQKDIYDLAKLGSIDLDKLKTKENDISFKKNYLNTIKFYCKNKDLSYYQTFIFPEVASDLKLLDEKTEEFIQEKINCIKIIKNYQSVWIDNKINKLTVSESAVLDALKATYDKNILEKKTMLAIENFKINNKTSEAIAIPIYATQFSKYEEMKAWKNYELNKDKNDIIGENHVSPWFLILLLIGTIGVGIMSMLSKKKNSQDINKKAEVEIKE